MNSVCRFRSYVVREEVEFIDLILLSARDRIDSVVVEERLDVLLVDLLVRNVLVQQSRHRSAREVKEAHLEFGELDNKLNTLKDIQ